MKNHEKIFWIGYLTLSIGLVAETWQNTLSIVGTLPALGVCIVGSGIIKALVNEWVRENPV